MGLRHPVLHALNKTNIALQFERIHLWSKCVVECRNSEKTKQILDVLHKTVIALIFEEYFPCVDTYRNRKQ